MAELTPSHWALGNRLLGTFSKGCAVSKVRARNRRSSCNRNSYFIEGDECPAQGPYRRDSIHRSRESMACRWADQARAFAEALISGWTVEKLIPAWELRPTPATAAAPTNSGSSVPGQVATDATTQTAVGEVSKLGTFGSALGSSALGEWPHIRSRIVRSDELNTSPGRRNQ